MNINKKYRMFLNKQTYFFHPIKIVWNGNCRGIYINTRGWLHVTTIDKANFFLWEEISKKVFFDFLKKYMIEDKYNKKLNHVKSLKTYKNID